MSKKIGFVGVGNMSTAIISGVLSAGLVCAENINLFDVLSDKTDVFVKSGCCKKNSIHELVSDSAIVVLAVKPQNFPEVLAQVKEHITADKLLVSIAAGISIDYIVEHLGITVPVIRVLPNTPMLLGEGVSAITSRSPVTEEQLDFVKEIFGTCSKVFYIDEDKFDEIICVHSSSPAYVFLMAQAMSEGAQEQGIDRETALKMIAQTFIGAAKMIENSGLSCEQLITMVASKGGTTEASLRSFEKDNYVSIVKNAMLACTDRAKELGGRK